MAEGLTFLPPKEAFEIDQAAVELVADFTGLCELRLFPGELYDPFERELYDLARPIITSGGNALGTRIKYVDVYVYDMEPAGTPLVPFWHTDSGIDKTVLVSNHFGPDFVVGTVNNASPLRDAYNRRFEPGLDYNTAVERAIEAEEIQVLKTGTTRALKFTKKQTHRSAINDTEETVRRCLISVRG